MWRKNDRMSKQLIDLEVYNAIDPVCYQQLPKRVNHLRNQEPICNKTPAHATISIQDFRDAFFNTIAMHSKTMVKNSTSSKNLQLEAAINKKAKQSVGTHKSALHSFRSIDDVSESETFLNTFKYEAKKPKQSVNCTKQKYDLPYFLEITAQLKNQTNISRRPAVVKGKQVQGSASVNHSKNKLTSLLKLKHKKGNNLVKKCKTNVAANGKPGTLKINKLNSKKNQLTPKTKNVKMASVDKKKKQKSKKPVKKLITNITKSNKSKPMKLPLKKNPNKTG